MPFSLRSRVLALVICLPVAATAQVRAVSVAAQMTADGRKVTPPTKESPTYYFPTVAGYSADGAPMAGEKEPPQVPILQKLAVELANQNYFVATEKTPAATVLLVFNWGFVNPPPESGEVFEVPRTLQEEQQADRAANPPRGTGLAIAGLTNSAVVENDQVGSRVQDQSRYLVVVTAYDYAIFASKKKKVQLWKTIMSVPMAGTSLVESFPRMISEGAPMFGREPAPAVKAAKKSKP